MRLAVAFLVLAVTLVATLVATGRASASAMGRTLRIGLVQQPNSLDPLHATQFYENYIAEATFSGLAVIDDRGAVVPDLAEAIPTRRNGGISADGKTLAYRLRPNLHWSDGAPLRSADVRYTLERMRDPATNFAQLSVYAPIARIETPDPRTVVVRLKAPWADATAELFVGGESGSIVPQHVLARVRDLNASSFESKPIGSGPYVVERWNRGSSIVLRANPTYFLGKPAIDRIDIDFVPDQTVLGLQIRTHEIDFSPQLDATDAAQLEHAPGFSFADPATYSDEELIFNLRRAPFDDVRVRRALALALDRAEIVRTVYHGFAEVGDDQLPAQSPYHVRDPTLRPSGDLPRARALLDEAGWRVASDGKRARAGAPLAFALTIPSGFVAVAAVAVQLQATWRSLGIDVTLRPIASNQLFAPVTGTLSRGDFDVDLETDGYANVPDHSGWITTADAPPHGLNYARFSDPDVDRWMRSARESTDVAKRRAFYTKIAVRLRERAPVVPFVWVHRPTVWNAALAGVRPETVNSDFWNVYAWHWRA